MHRNIVSAEQLVPWEAEQLYQKQHLTKYLHKQELQDCFCKPLSQ